MLEAARKDGQTVTAKGEMVGLKQIQGLLTADIRPVLTHSGSVAEIFRDDGPFQGFHMQQINHCILRPGQRSDWHMHRVQNDVILELSTLPLGTPVVIS